MDREGRVLVIVNIPGCGEGGKQERDDNDLTRWGICFRTWVFEQSMEWKKGEHRRQMMV